MNTRINRAETCARSGLKASILNRATDRKQGKIEFDFEINCSPNSRIVLENPNPPIGSGWNSPNFELPPGSQNLSGTGSNRNEDQILDRARFIQDPISSRENANPSYGSTQGTPSLSAVVSKGNAAQILDGSKAWMDTMNSRENVEIVGALIGSGSVRTNRNEDPIAEGTPGAGSRRKNFLIDLEKASPKQAENSIDEATGILKGHKRRATDPGVSSVYYDEHVKNIVHRYKESLKIENAHDSDEDSASNEWMKFISSIAWKFKDLLIKDLILLVYKNL